MLISHVITRLIVGGAQENTVATVLGLHSRPRYQVELLSGLTPPDQPEGSLQSLVEAQPGLLQLIPELVRPVSPRFDWLALLKMTRHFQRTRPCIVHTHSGKAGVLGRLAARRAGVPHIIHSIHGPSFGPFQGAGANLVFRTAERVAGRVTERFVGVAEAMCQQYLSARIGRPEQYRKIFSGFDLGPFLAAKNDASERARWGIDPEDIVIGKVGRLFQLKGHEALFSIADEIFKALPHAKLMLVGGGEWRERFERIVAERGWAKRVVFTGLVRPHEVPRLIGIMDLVVHLSRREGLARVLPQALAAGKPIVALDSDGAREVCLDGRHGYLIPMGDTDSLTEKVVRLAGNRMLREEMGARGRLFVEREFAEATMVDRIISLYDEVLEGS